MTKKQMTRFGIQFSTIDLGENPEARSEIEHLGFQQAPVVVAGNTAWSGFRLNLITELATIFARDNRKAG